MPDDLTPLWISLKTAIASTLLAAGLGILAARWMLSYRGKRSGYGLIDGLLTLPLVLPPTVVGFLLLVLLPALKNESVAGIRTNPGAKRKRVV